MTPLTLRLYFVLSLFAVGTVSAETPFFVKSLRFTGTPGDQVAHIDYPFDRDHYYVLMYGQDLGMLEPVDIVWPSGLFVNSTLTKELQTESQGYFKVVQYPLEYGWDQDGDSVDDWYELKHSSVFDAMDPDDVLSPSHGRVLLKSREEFEALARRDNVPGALGIQETKFLVADVESKDPILYFLNTKNHPYHSCFVQDGLRRSTAGFNSITYFRETGRTFIAGSMLAHDAVVRDDGGQGVYTMEFWPTDPVPYRYVQLVYDLITEGFPHGKDFVMYHPNGSTQEELYESEKEDYDNSNIPIIFSDELFGNQTFSPLNTGTSFGRLKVYSSSETYSARDIVIFKTIPNDINITAGIITEVPQTPLSHVNLKAQQNEIPNAYIDGASTDSEIAPLIGKYVEFTVTADGFDFREATADEVEAYLDSVRPSVSPVLESDLTEQTIRDLDDIGFTRWTSFGVKAANVAQLRKILDDELVPDGFAVPFYFYDEFMKHNGFYEDAVAMMEGADFQGDPEKREDALKAFRDRIRDEGEAPQWMLDALQTMHENWPEGSSVRCRSSTNNEDLEGFNGAGLYSSYTHKPDEGHIIKSMKQVWASLWTFRAFEERDFYRIDHTKVYMGVLVHPNSKEEQANGVAITRNIFDPRWDGYYVNVQVGEDLVTNPDEESVPEEFLISYLIAENNNYHYEVQYARYSNRVPVGETVLSEDQATDLAEKLETIQNEFRTLYKKWGDNDFAMDVEFKIEKDGTLLIKQARPWVWPGLPDAENTGC